MSGQPVQVTVTLTAAQYRAISSIADRKRTNASHLIGALVDRALNPPIAASDPAHTLRKRSRAVVTEGHLAQIRELSALNWSDREIGAKVGLDTSTIYRHRKRLDIPKDNKGGRLRKHTEQENAA